MNKIRISILLLSISLLVGVILVFVEQENIEAIPPDIPEGSPPPGNGTPMNPGFLPPDLQEHFIKILEENGVETTRLQDAFKVNDTAMIKEFTDEYPDLVPTPEPRGLLPEMQEQFINSLKENRIDTTEIEEAIKNNETEIIRVYMDKYRDHQGLYG